MKRRFGHNDLELLCVVIFWAFNVTVVKISLREMEPLAFNMVRFSCAAVVLLGLTGWLEGTLRIERRDVGRFVLLGLVGHTLYQLCFVMGLARTTASSTSLIFGASPVVVALFSRLAGHERIDLAGGAGALLAFYGVYLLVGGDGSAGGRVDTALTGNLLVLIAVVCWSAYTVLARDLLDRYSPLRVSALTLSIGTVFLALPAIPDLRKQDWAAVSALTWAGLLYSFIFALVISYVLWYRSVKEVGNLRTAVYSNLVPVLGMLFGIWLLDEKFTSGLAMGGACILGGIFLTRWRAPRRASPPAAGTAAP